MKIVHILRCSAEICTVYFSIHCLYHKHTCFDTTWMLLIRDEIFLWVEIDLRIYLNHTWNLLVVQLMWRKLRALKRRIHLSCRNWKESFSRSTSAEYVLLFNRLILNKIQYIDKVYSSYFIVSLSCRYIILIYMYLNICKSFKKILWSII